MKPIPVSWFFVFILSFSVFGFAVGFGTAKSIKPKPELSASEAVREMQELTLETDFGAGSEQEKQELVEDMEYFRKLAEISERAGLH